MSVRYPTAIRVAANSRFAIWLAIGSFMYLFYQKLVFSQQTYRYGDRHLGVGSIIVLGTGFSKSQVSSLTLTA